MVGKRLHMPLPSHADPDLAFKATIKKEMGLYLDLRKCTSPMTDDSADRE
jgi:hypothetical protein